ncbi:YitT family protein [Bacillus sp. 31A1R]|uniref:YitT family protein n=1 Tax=Robertmurraya mangrovi TaxID=3098077 RepID=A0ABU5J3M2_9BACI|nr:YitT family protein [Bacillus sp. 31A1R]MDZ5473966.1 YitT family protein [Bacillus sp. 31A1R]
MLEKLLAMIVGSFIIAVGINGFIIPHHLLDGGIIGIGLIIHYYYELPTGVSMIILSIPLYCLAWFYEKKYFFYSLQGLLVSSILIDLLSFLSNRFELTILPSAVIGGLLVGCGIGLMLRYETSTGGTDLLAQLLSKVVSLNVGMIIFIIDGIVILCGLKLVGLEKFMYSFITIIFVGLMTTFTLTRKTELQ